MKTNEKGPHNPASARQIGIWASSRNSLKGRCNSPRYIGVYKFAEVRIENGMPAIIDRALFEDVQERVRRRKEVAGRRRDSADFLLTGKVFCAKCGAPMVGISGTSKSGAMHYYYACKSRREDHSCTKLNVRKEAAEHEVASRLKSIILQPDVVEWMITNVLRFQEEARKQSDLTSYQEWLVEVRRGIDNLVKAVEAGIFSQSTKARLDELEGEQRELQGMIAAEQAKIKTVTRDQIEYYLDSFREGSVDDPSYQKRLFKAFLGKAYLDDDKLRIVYNYADGLDTMEFSLTLEDIKNAEAAPGCSYKVSSPPPQLHGNFDTDTMCVRVAVQFSLSKPLRRGRFRTLFTISRVFGQKRETDLGLLPLRKRKQDRGTGRRKRHR